MATCTDLKQMYLQDNHKSDIPSEISSVDSEWSDLKSIATQLGVANMDDLYTERFKIDCQKLSDMLQGNNIYDHIQNVIKYSFSNIEF